MIPPNLYRNHASLPRCTPDFALAERVRSVADDDGSRWNAVIHEGVSCGGGGVKVLTPKAVDLLVYCRTHLLHSLHTPTSPPLPHTPTTPPFPQLLRSQHAGSRYYGPQLSPLVHAEIRPVRTFIRHMTSLCCCCCCYYYCCCCCCCCCCARSFQLRLTKLRFRYKEMGSNGEVAVVLPPF